MFPKRHEHRVLTENGLTYHDFNKLRNENGWVRREIWRKKLKTPPSSAGLNRVR